MVLAVVVGQRQMSIAIHDLTLVSDSQRRLDSSFSSPVSWEWNAIAPLGGIGEHQIGARFYIKDILSVVCSSRIYEALGKPMLNRVDPVCLAI